MTFDLQIDYRAHADIEQALDYYMSKSEKIAKKFYARIEKAYNSLE